MAELPPLRGTLRQRSWAAEIRNNTFMLDGWTEAQVKQMEQIDDSTWWIANRQSLPDLSYKQPAAWQLVGGPPQPVKVAAPAKANTVFVQPDLVAARKEAQQAADNDALRFAASVSRCPALAEVTILALLARCYKPQTGMRKQLQMTAKITLDRFLDEHAEQERKDLDAVNRIINTKD